MTRLPRGKRRCIACKGGGEKQGGGGPCERCGGSGVTTTAGEPATVEGQLVPEAKLHRIHAEPASGKGGCSFDIGLSRWRGEGGTSVEKREVARRLAFTWNMAEGIPTEALEAGCVRDFYVAVDELLGDIDALDLPDDSLPSLKKLKAAIEAHQFDNTNGRAHDCESCLAKERERKLL